MMRRKSISCGNNNDVLVMVIMVLIIISIIIVSALGVKKSIEADKLCKRDITTELDYNKCINKY